MSGDGQGRDEGSLDILDAEEEEALALIRGALSRMDPVEGGDRPAALASVLRGEGAVALGTAGVLRLGRAVFRLHANPLDAEAIDVVFEGKGGAP